MTDSTPIAVVDLLLDEENPRLDAPNQGQMETIRAMAILQGNHLQALATDIVRHGLDPSNLFIVMKANGGRYVVLDGNRRASVLKALENPEIVKDVISSGVLRALRQLSSEYSANATETVQCVVVNDRSEADHWIELKHTGYQDGVGPLRWGPDEGARFRARTGGLLDAETQALNFLQDRGAIEADFRRRVPTTTFRRLLRTPAVREKLGLAWKDNTLIIEGDEKAVADALLYVAKDLTEGGITVRDLDRRDDRLRYAESLPDDIVVPKSAGQTAKPATNTKKTQSRAARPRTRQRERLIPADAALNVTEARVRDISVELQNLSLQAYPNAVSVLFRVFLELSADSYMDVVQLQGVSEEDSLSKKLLEVTKDLVAKQKLTGQQAKVVRRAAQRDSYLGPSVTGMHQYLHNKHQFPGPADLRADWDSLQPWFKAVWSSDPGQPS